MHPQQGPPYYRPQRRPPPNYAARRAVAATGALLAMFVFFKLVGAMFGGGGGDDAAVTSSTPEASTTTTTLVAPPLCAVADEPTIFGRAEDWARTIVDTTYAVDDLYGPPDLVSASEANYASDFRIRSIIAADLNGMRNAILSAGVPEVALLAAYRSIDDQRALFNRRVAEMGEEAAIAGTARPGHSEHHLGTTIDFRLIGETEVDATFGATSAGQWLAANAWKHGFLMSYPEGKTTVSCYKYEPWHFRYVGVPLAARVTESGLTLREYLWHWERTGSEPGQSTATTAPLPVSEPPVEDPLVNQPAD